MRHIPSTQTHPEPIGRKINITFNKAPMAAKPEESQMEISISEIIRSLTDDFEVLSLNETLIHLKRTPENQDFDDTVKIHLILEDLARVTKTKKMILENFSFPGEKVQGLFHFDLDCLILKNCQYICRAMIDFLAFDDVRSGSAGMRFLGIEGSHLQDYDVMTSLLEFVKANPKLQWIEIYDPTASKKEDRFEDFSDKSAFVRLLASGLDFNQNLNRKIAICKELENNRIRASKQQSL